MGQVFYACAYDVDARTCCVIDADKFNANCYAHSGAVLSMHYLLRQKPYRIMWGGIYVSLDDNLDLFSRTEDLLGISTYTTFEYFENSLSEYQSRTFHEKVSCMKQPRLTY